MCERWLEKYLFKDVTKAIFRPLIYEAPIVRYVLACRDDRRHIPLEILLSSLRQAKAYRTRRLLGEPSEQKLGELEIEFFSRSYI
jgi:hypothetical protein